MNELGRQVTVVGKLGAYKCHDGGLVRHNRLLTWQASILEVLTQVDENIMMYCLI